MDEQSRHAEGGSYGNETSASPPADSEQWCVSRPTHDEQRAPDSAKHRASAVTLPYLREGTSPTLPRQASNTARSVSHIPTKGRTSQRGTFWTRDAAFARKMVEHGCHLLDEWEAAQARGEFVFSDPGAADRAFMLHLTPTELEVLDDADWSLSAPLPTLDEAHPQPSQFKREFSFSDESYLHAATRTDGCDAHIEFVENYQGLTWDLTAQGSEPPPPPPGRVWTAAHMPDPAHAGLYAEGKRVTKRAERDVQREVAAQKRREVERRRRRLDDDDLYDASDRLVGALNDEGDYEFIDERFDWEAYTGGQAYEDKMHPDLAAQHRRGRARADAREASALTRNGLWFSTQRTAEILDIKPPAVRKWYSRDKDHLPVKKVGKSLSFWWGCVRRRLRELNGGPEHLHPERPRAA